MTQSVFALILAITAFSSIAQAADPQPYRVDIASVGDGDMDATIKATSDLLLLRGTAPVSPFGLIARGRSDVDRLKTAVESFGYYQSAVVIKINGMLVSNPSLGDVLTALPAGEDAQVAISFTLGPLYHLGRIDIDGDLPEAMRASLGLTTGQPAVADAVLAGGARLQSALQEQGYAFAKVDTPVAYESAQDPVLDLRFHVTVGAKVNIGAIHIEGLKRVHESLLRNRLMLHTGDPYRPSAIERARNDLLALGVFNQVSLQIGATVDETGGVPVTFKIRERLRHAIAVNAALSSDLGGSGGVTWTDRNVFGGAQQLTVAASVINVGGSDTTGVGYDTSVKYLMPDVGHRDQSLQFAIGALKQSLQAYDQTAKTVSATFTRKLSTVWSASAGTSLIDEQIIQDNQTLFYTLVALPMGIAYDSTNLPSPLEDPRHGMRAALNLTPTIAIGHPNSTFLISQIRASAYFDLDELLPTGPGRTVLAGRALVGLAKGAGETSLPPDQRFYAGGSGTIRGYKYQSVGPQFADNSGPIGGTAIEVGSLELRQRFLRDFGFAVFTDAGQVSSSLHQEDHNEFRVGVGVGLRYYTPIGPVRLDVAVPIARRPDDDSFEFYIGLGQAF